jgi:hypothetical protein
MIREWEKKARGKIGSKRKRQNIDVAIDDKR